jgi:hypothetical protein
MVFLQCTGISGKYAVIHGFSFFLTYISLENCTEHTLLFMDFRENILDKIAQEKPYGLHLSLNTVLLLYWFAACSQTGIFRGFSQFFMNLTRRQLYKE